MKNFAQFSESVVNQPIKLLVIYNYINGLQYFSELKEYVLSNHREKISLIDGVMDHGSTEEKYDRADAVLVLGDSYYFADRAFYELDKPNLLKHKGKKPLIFVVVTSCVWEMADIWDVDTSTNPAVCINPTKNLYTMTHERRKLLWEELVDMLEK